MRSHSKTRSLPASPLQSVVLLLNYNVLVPTGFVLVVLKIIIIIICRLITRAVSEYMTESEAEWIGPSL